MVQRKLKRKKLARILLITLICIGMIIPADTSYSSETMENLEIQINEAKNELKEAEEEQKAAVERYGTGSLGFIDWMLSKEGLEEWQKSDLNSARNIITKACEENFSRWGIHNTGLPESRNNMVTCLGDLSDAIALSNLRWSFSILKDINDIRASDENYTGVMKRSEAKTNFAFMAIAQTGADRAAVLKRHTILQSDCENLTSFSSYPAYMWRAEIETFNKYKKELGMDSITSEEDVEKIDNLAFSNNEEVGHYTNLFWADNQVMGVGHCNYGNAYCYNASKITGNKDEYYTIDEFEALFDEYYLTVGPDVLQEKVNSIKEKIDGLMNLYYQSCPGHIFETSDIAEACKHGAGTLYVCTKCGYQNPVYTSDALGHDFLDGICTRCNVTGPKTLKSVDWMSGSSWNQTSAFNQTYEEGQDVIISINYSTASASMLEDEFTIDIADPEVMSYEPANNRSGTMHMNTTGKTSVTIYPTENPSLTLTYNIVVEESRNHKYVINQTASTGSGKTTKVCTECGKVADMTIPAAITGVRWLKNGYGPGTYEPGTYKTGEYAELAIEYSPADADNHQFVIEISDTSIATLSRATAFDGTLNMAGRGDLTVTIYAKYDPGVKREYKFKVVGENEDATETPLPDSGKTPAPSPSKTPAPTKTPAPSPSKTPAPTKTPSPSPSKTPAPSPSRTPVPTKTPVPAASKTPVPGTSKTPEPVQTPGTGITEPQSIGQAVVVLSSLDYTYDGKAKTPDVVSVSIGDNTLKESTDYTIDYADNTNIGTAAVIITGTGNYTGNITKNFTISARKGTVFTYGSCMYKITSQTEAAFIGLNGYNAKSVVIPKNVKIGGKIFKITSIGEKAFFKTKVYKVTIGANVKKIGAKAFNGCNKLEMVVIKSIKIKSIGKNVFKGINNKVTVKVPGSKVKAYKKIIKSKGAGKNIKVKK